MRKTDIQTDMTRLRVAFRKCFVRVPKLTSKIYCWKINFMSEETCLEDFSEKLRCK